MPTNDGKGPAKGGRRKYAHARPSVADSKRAIRPEPAASIAAGGLSAGGAEGGGAQLLLTRRGFLYGALGVAAAAVVGTGAFAAAGGFAPVLDMPALAVPTDSVFTTDDCEFVDDTGSVLTEAASLALPYGSMVWASDPSVAACLLPTETGSPLAQVGLISLGAA